MDEHDITRICAYLCDIRNFVREGVDLLRGRLPERGEDPSFGEDPALFEGPTMDNDGGAYAVLQVLAKNLCGIDDGQVELLGNAIHEASNKQERTIAKLMSRLSDTAEQHVNVIHRSKDQAAEIARLRAEVERLTRERDEARKGR